MAPRHLLLTEWLTNQTLGFKTTYKYIDTYIYIYVYVYTKYKYMNNLNLHEIEEICLFIKLVLST